MKKRLARFLRGEPLGQPADGRLIGIGLAAALRKQRSADDAERFLTRWAEQRHMHKSAR
ncbi:hypothetical protein OUY22_16925 [Nonomuraea sp. MCN248]|uniref:Uncharacterized protein n=1 Tax=Nonomuraea corallina TaxID=2989783 RepID=A0ABT4SDQ8_9ACTN|nr:hypothetical protein [Nonomuraea corallina]MDA0635105.1 hypothetical protein [Nonomuraea corallina]